MLTKFLRQEDRKEKSMKLETDRLILRSIQRGDEKIFAKMAIDGSLQQVGFDENSHEWINDWILEAEELTRNDNPRINYIPCTIELKSTGEVIGSVGSTYYEDFDKVGICYFAGSEFREKGYVTEAVQAFITFFFEHYNESELMLTILDDNISSWKIAEKVGFTLVEKKMYQDIDDEKEELYRFYALNR